MLSKANLKYIRSLELKKNRKADQVFVAEGPKIVNDLQGHFPCRFVMATEDWMDMHPDFQAEKKQIVTLEELTKASFLKHPQEVLAIFAYQHQPESPTIAAKELCLALDNIQDPGNLGTIIRIADWFGIRHIFCSPETADVYNPKVVQATMGALARVKIHYIEMRTLTGLLKEHEIPIYGTFLDGENIYAKELSAHGMIIMGNEGNGISPDIRDDIKERLYIPCYPPEGATSESLNVAIATAIVCAEFRRRMG